MCIDLYVQGDSTDWTEYYDLWDFIRNNKAKLQRGGTIKFSKDEVASVVREIYKAMVNLK
jgi:hypothetical protein